MLLAAFVFGSCNDDTVPALPQTLEIVATETALPSEGGRYHIQGSELHCFNAIIYYDPNNPGTWRFAIGEDSSLSGSGWDVTGPSYISSNRDLTDLYVISNEPDHKTLGTADRGRLRGNTTGAGVTASYWEGLIRKTYVYGSRLETRT